MNKITLKSKLRPSKDVVSRKVQNEEVILNLELGTYYGLDEIGTQIWDLLKSKKALSHIAASIAEEFDVKLDRVQKDVLAIAKDMKANHLVEII